MSEINFCNTKEQLNHLGEVVTGKVDGSPSGADIEKSTLSYTGQVRKTLPALEAEYLEAIRNAGGEPLNGGVWAAGQTFTAYNQYMIYNDVPYKPLTTTTLPYGPTGATPDGDFVGPFESLSLERAAEVFSNPNLLSNSNFLTPSPDAITHPNATPESYAAGTQIFSGVYAGASGVTVTLIDGRVNCSAGSYEYRVPNTNGLDRVPVFTSSVSDYDGNPVTTGVSHALVSDEYVVTVTPATGDVFSVKFEQGDIATKHEVQSFKGQNYTFNTVSEMIALKPTVGSKVNWLGYFEASDGGGNWGIVKNGSHTEDGGSIFSIDANTYVEANIKGTVNFSKFGCVGQAGDVTGNMQNALNVVDGKLVSLPGITHITSSTLFNQKPNRTVDFKWSKIKNQTNSRFAIVSVSDSLATQDDASLATFMAEAHFDEQLERAGIVNVEIEMMPNTSGGSNLCIGMIYCKFSGQKAKITASNSNATQIQGSYNCSSDIVTDGHRGYGTFNYMSKYTDIKLNTVGGSRGVVIKHAYYDDPDVDVVIDIIAKNVNGRAIGGGASAGTGASPALEPLGHEIVRGVNVKRARLTTDSTFDYQPDIIVGFHADKWKFNDIQIRNKSTDTNTFNINIGGEGTAGFFVGGGHTLDGVDIDGAKSDGVPIISMSVTGEIKNSVIDGKYFSAVRFGPLVDLSDDTPCKVDNLTLKGQLINTGTGRGIIDIDSSVGSYIERDLTVIAETAENAGIPSRTQLAIVYCAARLMYQSGQSVKVKVPGGSKTTTIDINRGVANEMHTMVNSTGVEIESDEALLTSAIAVNTSAAKHQIALNYMKMVDNQDASTTGVRYLGTGGTPSLNTFDGWDTNQSSF